MNRELSFGWSAGSLQPVWSSACLSYSFGYFSKLPKWRPLRTFLNLGKRERENRVAGIPQECLLMSNIQWRRGQCDIGCFHGGASICLLCQVSRDWLFFWAFQGRIYKKKTWLTVCPGGTNSVCHIACSVATPRIRFILIFMLIFIKYVIWPILFCVLSKLYKKTWNIMTFSRSMNYYNFFLILSSYFTIS